MWAEDDVQTISAALDVAERRMFYIGDGIWKSNAENQINALAEHYGAAVAIVPFSDIRGVSVPHQLHCGRIDDAARKIKPDQVFCFGVRHRGNGKADDFDPRVRGPAAYSSSDRI